MLNVTCKPVHHHCHLYTDFITDSHALNLNHFSLLDKSNNFIFWKACQLVVLVGFDPRPNVTQKPYKIVIQLNYFCHGSCSIN